MLNKFAVALVAASMLTAPVFLASTSQAAPATTQTMTVPASKASVKTVKTHRKHVRHAKRHTAKIMRQGKVHTAKSTRHGKAVKHARKVVRQPATPGTKPAA